MKKPTKSHSNLANIQHFIRGTDDLLTKLWRIILRDSNVQPSRWEALLNRYLRRDKNIDNTSSRIRSIARGNLSKQFHADRITWKTFMRGLHFIGAEAVVVTVKYKVGGRWKESYIDVSNFGDLMGAEVVDVSKMANGDRRRRMEQAPAPGSKEELDEQNEDDED